MRRATGRAQRYNSAMEQEAAELLARALQLPEEARAALADSLLESLDTKVGENADDALRLEIRHRLAEIDSKAVELIPWSDAHSRLNASSRVLG